MVTGALGALALLLALAVAVLVPRWSFTARTQDYTAEFANAAGLAPGDQVTVAGVPAGRVTGVTLAGDRVRVEFRLDRTQPLGTETTAAVKLATVLGKRYLGVQPAGPGRLDPGAVIPLSRTTVPYSLDDLTGDTARTVSGLDLPALQQMLDTLHSATPGDPALVAQALQGVNAATRMVTRRGDQLTQLLTGARAVTSSLLEQQDTLVKLLGDADIVAQVLNSRRDVIRQLITDVGTLTSRLNGFLKDNSEVLNPLLANLNTVTTSLAANEKAISDALTQLAPASRYLADATGNGPWGDVSGPAGPLPDNLLCLSGLIKVCR